MGEKRRLARIAPESTPETGGDENIEEEPAPHPLVSGEPLQESGRIEQGNICSQPGEEVWPRRRSKYPHPVRIHRIKATAAA